MASAKGPVFDRAKRFTHKHTDHHTVFKGSETTHVKSNLTASIDGNYDIKADQIDYNGAPALNLKNVIRSKKVTIDTDDITGISLASPLTVGLFRASPGDTIYEQVGKLTAAFYAGATVHYSAFKVGDAADTDGLGKEIHIGSPVAWQWTTQTALHKGEYLYASLAHRNFKTYSAATMINLTLTASTVMLGSLDAGSIDFYFDIMSRS